MENEIDYKALAIKFATSLVDVLDGIQEHDIQNFTGLSDAECKRINNDRLEALELLKKENIF